MAISLNGTVNGLPADRLPIGYTPPVVTTINDFHYRYDVVIPIAVTGTVASSAIASMTAIVSATSTAVTAILTADFLSTGSTVTAYAVINDIGSTFAPTNNNTSMTYLLSATTNQYLVNTTIFVKSI